MTLTNTTVAVCALLWLAAPALAQSRWKVDSDGGITWEVKPRDAHQDQIEMSGRKISAIITYGGRENGALTLTRPVVFPCGRFPTTPRQRVTRLAMCHTARVYRRQAAREVVSRIHHWGLITVDSMMGSVALTRTLFPSVDKPVYLEKYSFTNRGTRDITVEVESTENTVRTSPARGVTGAYIISSHVPYAGVKTVKPGEGVNFAVVFTAREAEAMPRIADVESEERARLERIDGFLKLRFGNARCCPQYGLRLC
jgi:hypothetical protein